MPLTDYDFSKTLQATSFNDSGNTVDKAQPILLRGNDYTGVDGFESGSSQLNWESETSITIDSNSELYLNNSLQFNSPGQLRQEERTLAEEVNSDGKRITGSLKIDNQTGNSSDVVRFEVTDNSTKIAYVDFQHDGNIADGQGNNIGTWSQNFIYDIEIVLDFTNNQYDIIIDEDELASNVSFDSSASKINAVRLSNVANNSGSTVNAFFDRLTYTAPVEDSINAGGFIGYDSNTVAGPEDVAFYDQNDNLLDYEIENGGDLGSSSAEVTAWVYKSYPRDDSDQLKLAFGNNSANEDRSMAGTGGNPWNNTGQSAVMVQHLQDDPLTATDSTSNNNDGTVNGATATTGEFNGAASFDGVDDKINFDSGLTSFMRDSDGSYTINLWVNFTTTDSSQGFYSARDSADVFIIANEDNTGEIRFFHNDGTSSSIEIASDAVYNDGEWHNVVATYDGSSNTATLYVDGTEVGNLSLDIAQSKSSENAIGSIPGFNQFFEGDIDEHKLNDEAKSSDWIQADFDASPKAGQVFFTQDAAEPTVTATEATASKYSASYSSLTPNVIVNKIATASKYSGTYSALQADSISNSTSTATKYAGSYSSQTASTSFSATIQATKYSATYSSQTAATTTIEVAPATKYTGTYTTNTAKTALPITANATKYSASYSSQTATTVQILSAAADKYSASYSSRTAGTVSIKTAPVTKYSANYSTRQASTTFDATTNATKYSASYTSQTAATLVKQMAEADKYNLTYSSKTATAKILVSGPDVTYPLFVNEESMRKRIKDQ